MSITPDYIELAEDELEVEEQESTTDTWELDENTKTIRAIMDDYTKCVVQSVKCAIRTEQNNYEMYSLLYGSSIHEHLGESKPHVYAEVEFAIRKCLANDERISKVENFEFEDRKGNILVRFDITVSDNVVQIEEEIANG